MDFDQRLTRLFKSLAGDQLDQFREMLDQRLSDWEHRLGLDDEGRERAQQAGGSSSSRGQSKGQRQQSAGAAKPQTNRSGFDDAFLKDLAAFGLTPPTTLAALKKARKEELKKYHPDRFHQEPQKAEAAHRIVQILGDTYERLLAHPHFKSQTKK